MLVGRSWREGYGLGLEESYGLVLEESYGLELEGGSRVGRLRVCVRACVRVLEGWGLEVGGWCGR